MRILFLHDNFPAQFGPLGQHLYKKGWDVSFATQRKGVSTPGVNVLNYAPHRQPTKEIHPYAHNFEKCVLAGQAVARLAVDLKKRRYEPDIVMAHSGWGPGLYAKDIWPNSTFVGYFEWYYTIDAPDVAFLASDEPADLDQQLRGRSRNAPILTDLANCDAGICPTAFQASQFPAAFRDKLRVLHDGIDVETYAPAPGEKLILPSLDLSHVDELITYVARGMEPYRGFPQFMEALAIVLRERPNAHAVIVGEDRVAYGKKLPEGESFKKRALETLKTDWARVHFTGLLPRPDYLRVLQASSVHVYLTIPFVLSWSMMEAMSTGCAIVASDVAPVRELSDQAPDALSLVDMNDPAAIAAAMVRTLEDRDAARAQGEAARALIASKYAAKDIFAEKERWLAAL